MLEIHSNEPFSNFWGYGYTCPSIFLAGPTPRSKNVKSWRPEALEMLSTMNYLGIIFIPEPFAEDYDTRVGWELNALDHCDLILFWVPRDLETMPAFTTNVEFGMYLNSGKMVYGRPYGAPRTSYLDWHYKRVTKTNPYEDLKTMIVRSCDRPEIKRYK